MSISFLRVKPWVMWVLPLTFFAYQFILRLWPSLSMQEIMQQFHIDATGFGFLAAIYYFGYAGMQIPVAILLDRYGVKKVIALFALLCGFATLIFIHTHSWWLALMGRFLIGFASAAGFLGTSKAVSLWFPGKYYARMIGLTFSFGLLGAVYGGRPVNTLIENMGYIGSANLLAMVSLGLSVMIFFGFKDSKTLNAAMTEEPFRWKNLQQVLRNPALIILALANLLMVGALEGFADVWGVNYLVEAYHLPKQDAAGSVTFIFFGMLFGGPLLALLSEKWGGINVISVSGLGIAAIFTAVLFLCVHIDVLLLKVLLFSIGVLSCYQVIVFASSTQFISPHLMGISVAFLNCINMLGGSFFHSTIGYVTDLFWAGGMAGGCRIYSSEAYTYGLMIIPICACLGGLLVQLTKKR